VGKTRNNAGYRALQKVIDGNPNLMHIGPISGGETATEVLKLVIRPKHVAVTE
jgi:hypothetical protein